MREDANIESCQIPTEDEGLSGASVATSQFEQPKNSTVLGLGWDTQDDILFLDIASPLQWLSCEQKVMSPVKHNQQQQQLYSNSGWELSTIWGRSGWWNWTGIISLVTHKLTYERWNFMDSRMNHSRLLEQLFVLELNLNDGTRSATRRYHSSTWIDECVSSGSSHCQYSRGLQENVRNKLCGLLVGFADVVEWEFKQLVQNRVIEIRRLVSPENWNYCPSESNPAYICWRGMEASGLIKNQL